MLLTLDNYWVAFSVWIWGGIICSFLENIGLNTTRGRRYTNTNEGQYTNTNEGQSEDEQLDCEHEDVYLILGIHPTASDSEVKSAYRKMALTYHPDVCSDPAAASKYRIINNAYETIKALRGMK
jgi:hypothetical protein